ncbi:TIM barrel protein [Actinoplanes sp. NPDC051851]|uniref:sugar phosphate isomerase/epimerase family protein n=1 Tax=Actinoplanes sp. NPDC051851 TaxID=3154753 RepID=UPI00341B84BC
MIKTGSTLYAYTNEWRAGQYTLDEMIAKVAALNLGPGLEVVGFQSFKGFPHLTPDQIRNFRNALESNGLEPSCLGTNIDVALRSDRFLTEDEMVDYLAAQVKVARLLGYPVARIQIGATPGVIERIAPVAEKAGVKLGMELHAPEAATTPAIVAVRECYDRIGSEYLGFIPDFSATMTAVPRGMLDQFVRDGLPASLLPALVEIWSGDELPHVRFNRFAALAKEQGAEGPVVDQTRLAYTMFGHADPQGWREILDRVVHVHGKFYEIEDGTEPSIPYAELLGLLVEGGYDGVISSEWEGHAFATEHDVDAFALVGEHQEMCRTLLAAATSGGGQR